jgi:hypothetical protein
MWKRRINIIVCAVTLRLKGVSRFWQRDLEAGQLWKYSKQENITDFTSFHYCISETPALAGFSVIATANGFHPAMFFSNYVSSRPLLRNTFVCSTFFTV